MRVIAVPDAWVPPSPGQFQKDVMNALADMGEQMGVDPASWRTEGPQRARAFSRSFVNKKRKRRAR